MTASIGVFMDWPASFPDDYKIPLNYGSRKLIASVKGADNGINDSINKIGEKNFSYTGDNPDNYTSYAEVTLDLGNTENTYLGRRYEFSMYIDWNGNGSLDAGDVCFANYTLFLDLDNDPDTQAIAKNSEDYPEDVVFNAVNHSITIDDPLTYNSGLTWTVESIGIGDMVLFE